MKIAIVGTGYVGLTSGTCFAELGHDVVCVDIDKSKVDSLKHGKLTIYEPGLEDLFKRNLEAKRLHFTTDLADAVKDTEVIFLALPTPPGEDGSADLSYILGLADQLGPLLKQYCVVVDKSTVPVGTAEEVRRRIAKKAKVPFDVVSNPEFFQEGRAVANFMEPDRIVVGTSSKRAADIMARLYAPIVNDDHEFIVMDERSAELTKYAANTFLASKITFMNEVANLCELIGADVEAVRHGIGSDVRIGRHFLRAGIGYGGSCFPKDVQALLYTANEHGYDFGLLQAVLAANSRQQKRLTQKVLAHYNNNVAGKTFAIWGLAFKPETDDVRQAPALAMVRDLTAAGAIIQAYDPEAMDSARTELGDNPSVHYVKDQYEALQGADALIIATEWPQFVAAPLARIKDDLAKPVVFDGRNVFKLADAKQAGLHYESIGRAVVNPKDKS
jgi:UDPglucose 6-dehydrogenase